MQAYIGRGHNSISYGMNGKYTVTSTHHSLLQAETDWQPSLPPIGIAYASGTLPLRLTLLP